MSLCPSLSLYPTPICVVPAVHCSGDSSCCLVLRKADLYRCFLQKKTDFPLPFSWKLSLSFILAVFIFSFTFHKPKQCLHGCTSQSLCVVSTHYLGVSCQIALVFHCKFSIITWISIKKYLQWEERWNKSSKGWLLYNKCHVYAHMGSQHFDAKAQLDKTKVYQIIVLTNYKYSRKQNGGLRALLTLNLKTCCDIVNKIWFAIHLLHLLTKITRHTSAFLNNVSAYYYVCIICWCVCMLLW